MNNLYFLQRKEFSSLTLEYTHNGYIENFNSPLDIERIKIGQKGRLFS